MTRSGPLAGVRVVVTRAAEQAEELADLFESEGARVVRLPLLEAATPRDPRPLERAATELALYDWVAFTSSNAVRALLDAAGGAWPARTRAAAIGKATAEACRDAGIEVALVARESTAEGLARELAPFVTRRRRVLLPQAEDARPALGKLLVAAGAEVERVVAYRKRLPREARARAAELFATGPWGWVTFTSPSTVQGLAELLADDWAQGRKTLLAASIGPVTSRALVERGVEPAAQAATPSARGLVEAVVAAEIERATT